MNSLNNLPNHVAIIMDGNGRWAQKRKLFRVAGHAKGVKRAKEIVEHAANLNIKHITLFVFGKENWLRPKTEVSFLMKLLLEQMTNEFHKFHKKNVKISFIGDRTRIDDKIVTKMIEIEELTKNNNKINLYIAIDYSGSYDILQAVNKIVQLKIAQNDSTLCDLNFFNKFLLTYPNPDPDLLIRTGGERRISNFELIQISYTELYFTDTLWPDFDKKLFEEALLWFSKRERRFGKTSEQIKNISFEGAETLC